MGVTPSKWERILRADGSKLYDELAIAETFHRRISIFVIGQTSR